MDLTKVFHSSLIDKQQTKIKDKTATVISKQSQKYKETKKN